MIDVTPVVVLAYDALGDVLGYRLVQRPHPLNGGGERDVLGAEAYDLISHSVPVVPCDHMRDARQSVRDVLRAKLLQYRPTLLYVTHAPPPVRLRRRRRG